MKEQTNRKWTISLLELKENGDKKFKVTRKLSEFSVSETKIFNSKEEALKQLNKWLE